MVLGLLTGLATPANASEEFRCGSRIIEDGMNMDKVRELCGDPTEETGDRWVYDRGPDRFIVVLHVQPDNTVGLIETKPHL